MSNPESQFVQYNININQSFFANTSLDLKDCAILSYLWNLCASTNPQIRKQRIESEEGIPMTLVDYQTLLDHMPLLRLKTKEPISRRIKKIEKNNLIITHKNSGQRVYVRFTPHADAIFRGGNFEAVFGKTNGKNEAVFGKTNGKNKKQEKGREAVFGKTNGKNEAVFGKTNGKNKKQKEKSNIKKKNSPTSKEKDIYKYISQKESFSQVDKKPLGAAVEINARSPIVKKSGTDEADRSLASLAEELLGHYHEEGGHTRVKMTKGRKVKLNTRLKEFSLEEIKQAVTNAFDDDWWSGGNDRNWYLTLDYLLRNDENVDKLLNLKPKRNAPKTYR